MLQQVVVNSLGEVINFDNIVDIWPDKDSFCRVNFVGRGGSGHFYVSSKEERDELFKKFEKQVNKRRTSMDSLKAYFKKHEETYITLAIIILIDHFVFGGAFREKIHTLVDGLLSRTSKKLLKEEKDNETAN